MHTVQTAAAEIGVTAGQVREWCRRHKIGSMLTPRLRVLTAADVAALRKIARTVKLGRPPKQG